jgi:hypothetical protein
MHLVLGAFFLRTSRGSAFAEQLARFDKIQKPLSQLLCATGFALKQKKAFTQAAIDFRGFRRRTLAPNATNPVPNNSIEVGSGVTNPAVVNGVAPSVPLRHGCDDTTGQVKAVMSSPATFPSRLVRESRLSPQAVGVQLHQVNGEIRKSVAAGT